MTANDYFNLEDSLPEEVVCKFNYFCFCESNGISFAGKRCGGTDTWSKCYDCLKLFGEKQKEGR